MEQEQEKKESKRWNLARDVVSFQFKLALDGIRDVLLSPISISAALLGLMTRPNDPGKYYQSVIKFGRKSDHWINLFNTYNGTEADLSADEYIKRLENVITDEYNKGGVVKSLKDGTDDFFQKRFNK